jgi:hypothetical protein
MKSIRPAGIHSDLGLVLELFIDAASTLCATVCVKHLWQATILLPSNANKQ